LTTTAAEFFHVVNEISAMPESWLAWVEQVVRRREGDSLVLHRPLAYRLHVLWQGIIALQEGKFLCDLLESSLRQAFLDHSRVFQIAIGEVFSVVPGWQESKTSWEQSSGHPLQDQEAPTYAVLAMLSFYQLTELIARNWKRPSGALAARKHTRQAGLRHLFRKTAKKQQGVDAFRRDMKKIRQQRNIIAHSKKLLSPEDRQRLHVLTAEWLQLLGVSADRRILRYRRARPRFLEGLPMSPSLKRGSASVR